MALQTYTLVQTFIADALNQPVSTYAGNPFTFAQGQTIQADDGNPSFADVVNPVGEFQIPWDYLAQSNPNPAPTPTSATPTANSSTSTTTTKATTTASTGTNIFVILGLIVSVVSLIATFAHSPAKAPATK